MRRMPTGFGLAFLALAVAASVPVGGCRGQSPERVVRSESSGVDPIAVFTPDDVPKHLRISHDPEIAGRFNGVFEMAIEDLERPLGPDEELFGRNRLFSKSVGDHKVFHMIDNFYLFGNKTSKLSPESWSGTSIGFRTSADQQEQVRDQELVEPYAKEAASYFLGGYRDPIRWKAVVGAMEARPVVIRDESCLKCHTDSKIDDVAGLLIMKLNEADIAKVRIDRPRNP